MDYFTLFLNNISNIFGSSFALPIIDQNPHMALKFLYFKLSVSQ